jgi:biotin transport system substrate-specific component
MIHDNGCLIVRETAGHSGLATRAARLENRAVSVAFGVTAFVVMMALGAHVRIPLPFTPVPITLQTFFLSLAGATLGPVFGVASQVVYLFLGAVGVPVFAGGSGLMYLVQSATTGYLIGFVAAAALVGWLIRSRKDPGIAWILFSMAAGNLVVYTSGILWLSLYLHVSPVNAIAIGVVPFLAGDVAKACAAAGLFRGYRRRARIMFP